MLAKKHYLGIRLSLSALTLRLKNSCLSIDLAYLLTGSASFFGFLKDFLSQLSSTETLLSTLRRVPEPTLSPHFVDGAKEGKAASIATQPPILPIIIALATYTLA